MQRSAQGRLFDRVLGQKTAVETLTRSLSTGRLHHAYRFEGPEGVGRELTALALGQSLVCQAPSPLACGECSACRRAVSFSSSPPHIPIHPDIVLVGRGVYPKALLGREETAGISVEQVRRVILPRTSLPPHEGRALLFIIRDAHELGLQAANALLKTLEEPPNRTFFVLLTSQPAQLIDTIRSRTLPIRFRPLSEDTLRTIASTEVPLAREALALSGGSVSRALELSAESDLVNYTRFSDAVLASLQAPGLSEAVDGIEERPTDRHALVSRLQFLADEIARRARGGLEEDADRSLRLAQAHEAVLHALRRVKANLQPALALEQMVFELRKVASAPEEHRAP